MRNPLRLPLFWWERYYQLGFRLHENAAADFLTVAEKSGSNLFLTSHIRYHFWMLISGSLLKKEAVFSIAIGFFTALAIFISWSWIIWIVGLTAEQRTKEIGIRKVLGNRFPISTSY